MAAQRKPAIVLVHGAWHTPAHFEGFVAKLKTAGYAVDALQLPSVNNVEIDAPFAQDVATIKHAIQTISNSGQDVVVVMHSYGGTCGSEAVASFFEEAKRNRQPGSGTILRLIYIAAIILPRGKQLSEVVQTALETKTEGRLVHKLEPQKRFYNTTAQGDADKAIALLKPHNVGSFITPQEHQGWSDYNVPTTYIVCKLDQALEYDTDGLTFIQRLRDAAIQDLTILEMEDTDHSPWLSAEPQFWAMMLAELQKAEVYGKRSVM